MASIAVRGGNIILTIPADKAAFAKAKPSSSGKTHLLATISEKFEVDGKEVRIAGNVMFKPD